MVLLRSLSSVVYRHRLLTIFGLLLVVALLARLWLLQMLGAQILECRLCVVPGVLKADLPLLSGLAACFLLAYLVPRRWWSLPLRSLAVIGLLGYVSDMIVMSQFFTRLMWSDVKIYLGQPDIVWRHLGTFSWPYWVGGGLLLVGLVALCAKNPRSGLSWRAVSAGVVACAVLGVLGRFVIPAPGYA